MYRAGKQFPYSTFRDTGKGRVLTSPAPENPKGAPDPGPADGMLCRAAGHWLGSSHPALPSFVTLDPGLCGPYFSLGQLASYLALPVGKRGDRRAGRQLSPPRLLASLSASTSRCSSFWQLQFIPTANDSFPASFHSPRSTLVSPSEVPARQNSLLCGQAPALWDPVLTPGYQQKLVGALPSKAWDLCLHTASPSFRTAITPTSPRVSRSWRGNLLLQVLNPCRLSFHFHYHNHPISV